MIALQEMKSEYTQKVAQMRALNETTEERAWTGEVRGKWDSMKEDIQVLREKIDREELLREADQKFVEDRARIPASQDSRGQEPEQNGAFADFLRTGRESRSLSTETSTDDADGHGGGGYLVPKLLQNNILSSMESFRGVAEFCKQLVTENGASIEWPVLNSGNFSKGQLVRENTAVDESGLGFKNVTLNTHLLSSGMIRVSEQLLQDASGVNIEEYIASQMAERLARGRNNYVINGTPDSEVIKGLVSLAPNDSAAEELNFKTITNLIHSVDHSYRLSPSFYLAFNDKTLRSLVDLLDQHGRPLWVPSMHASYPDTILGCRYIVDPSISDENLFAGDFSRLVLRTVKGMTVKRLAERYADCGQVGFLAFMRFGLVLQDEDAIKKINVTSGLSG